MFRLKMRVMKQINAFDSKNMRQGEFYVYYAEVQTTLQEAPAVKAKIETLFADFQQALQAYQRCMVYARESALTKDMWATDGERRKLMVGLSLQIRGAQRHFDPEMREKARGLEPVLRVLQRGYNKSYTEKTGFVRHLLKAFRREPFRTNMEALHLMEWVDHLEAVNEQCYALFFERSNERSEVSSRGQATEARKQLHTAYRAIVRQLNARAIVEGDELYADLFDRINGHISHVRYVLAQRRGARAARLAAAKESPTEQPVAATIEPAPVTEQPERAAKEPATVMEQAANPAAASEQFHSPMQQSLSSPELTTGVIQSSSSSMNLPVGASSSPQAISKSTAGPIPRPLPSGNNPAESDHSSGTASKSPDKSEKTSGPVSKSPDHPDG